MSELISEAYRRQQEKLHANPDYGIASLEFVSLVASLVNKLRITELLDYGCGKGRLMHALQGKVENNLKIQCYDPAVPEFSTMPGPMQMVVCIDVLEHIEPEKLDLVLDDLRRCTKQVAYLVIHTGPSRKVLPDGRNTHLIQQSPSWWRGRLEKFFAIGTLIEKLPLIHLVAAPKYKVVHKTKAA